MLCLAGLASLLAVRPPSLYLAEIADQTVLLHSGEGEGSGVLLLGADGRTYFVTAHHCVKGIPLGKIWIEARDGRCMRADMLVAADAKHDLALLRLFDVHPCAQVAGTQARLGDEGLLIGNALGGSFPWYVAPGTVTKTDAEPKDLFLWPWAFPTICTDAHAEKGMSGCGMWVDGRLAGIFVGLIESIRIVVPVEHLRAMVREQCYVDFPALTL